jgi:hypothetical protein
MDPHAPRHLLFRRAVLGILLSAGDPVPDVLAQQLRMGRVRRVSRGVYEMVPGSPCRVSPHSESTSLHPAEIDTKGPGAA